MASAYYYPGTKNEFYTEFGGLPDRSLGLTNIFIIFIIIIAIIIIVTLILFLLAKTKTVYTDRTNLYNLDLLIDLNNPTTQCCVRPGGSAPTQEYIYDSVNMVTYSRQIPADVNVACDGAANEPQCVSDNTDSQGNIVPVATFAAQPYYTFTQGQFVGCPTTTTCL